MSKEDENRRETFRIRYPLGHQPEGTANGVAILVSEVSADGIRLLPLHRIEWSRSMDAGDSVAGNFHTEPDGVSIPFAGSLLRREAEELVVAINSGPPTSFLLAEQVRVSKIFPRIYDES